MKETLILHNDVSEVQKLAEWVETTCETMELPMSAVFQINLALEEAVVNVMNYAYPGQEGMPVRLTAEKQDNVVIFTLEDDGVAFDPTKADEPDITLAAEDRPIGGLGIFLVNQIMSEVVYNRVGETNMLKMVYLTNT